jgi:hypothetical protein
VPNYDVNGQTDNVFAEPLERPTGTRIRTVAPRTFCRCVAAASLLTVAAATLLAHDPITTKVTWEREIEPIVQARCVACHSSGGSAPMPLTTYAEARPWARAIREEVLTRRMPKWHIVRGYGDFTNDPSLSPFEIALITAWADGGAPFSKARPRGPASSPGDAAATARHAPPAQAGRKPGARSNVTIPCASRAMPRGRLAGLRPLLSAGGSLRLTSQRHDGSVEPLLWVRDFDPDFAETYWLRNPIPSEPGTRLILASTPDDITCSVTLFFE